jgi:integrase
MGTRKNRRQRGEGSIYSRKDGRWVAELHLGYKPDGRPDRRYFYGASPDEVIEKRRKFLAARDDGFTPVKGRGHTVAEWLAHWLENIARPRVRESTWNRSYKVMVNNHLIPGFGRRALLKDLDETAIEELYTRLAGDGLSPTTILQAHRVLSQALKVAAKRRLIARNPCQYVAPRVGDRPEAVPPERDEVALVLEAVRGRWNGARWALALGVGPRQGEALGLLWPMLDLEDLDNATMRIAWELVRQPWAHGCEDPRACGEKRHRRPCPPDRADCPKVRASGRPHVCSRPCPAGCTVHDGKCPRFCLEDCVRHASTCPQRTGGGLVLTEPKSKKSRRVVALPRRLAELLVEHRTWQAAERSAHAGWTGWGHDPETCERRPRAREIVCPKCRRPTKKDMLVFAQPSGAPIDSRRDWQEWADLLAELGIPHYRPHDARHFSATTALEEGVDVVVVQEMLGHATAAFTQATYQHVRPALQRAAADKIGEALWGDR